MWNTQKWWLYKNLPFGWCMSPLRVRKEIPHSKLASIAKCPFPMCCITCVYCSGVVELVNVKVGQNWTCWYTPQGHKQYPGNNNYFKFKLKHFNKLNWSALFATVFELEFGLSAIGFCSKLLWRIFIETCSHCTFVQSWNWLALKIAHFVMKLWKSTCYLLKNITTTLYTPKSNQEKCLTVCIPHSKHQGRIVLNTDWITHWNKIFFKSMLSTEWYIICDIHFYKFKVIDNICKLYNALKKAKLA